MAATSSTGGVRARTSRAGLPHRTRRHATRLGGENTSHNTLPFLLVLANQYNLIHLNRYQQFTCKAVYLTCRILCNTKPLAERLSGFDYPYQLWSSLNIYHSYNKPSLFTFQDLEDMGIVRLGHQKKILLAIKRVKDIRAGKRSISNQGSLDFTRIQPGQVSTMH